MPQNRKTDSLLLVLSVSKNDTSKVRTLGKLVMAFIKTNPDTAVYFANEGLKLAEELSFERGKAELLNKRGIIYKIQGEYEEAMECYKKSLFLFEKQGDKTGISMVCSNMGNVQKNLGNYAEALQTYLKALKIAEGIGKKEGVADLNLNIALIYDDLKNPDKAIEYLNKSLTIAEMIKDEDRVSRALLNIGIVYGQGDSDSKIKALEYYNRALEINRKLDDPGSISICLTNIGAVYYDIGKNDKSMDYYTQSFAIKQKLNDKKGQAILLENMAFILQRENKYQEARKKLEEALIIASEVGDLPLIAGVYQSQAENYKYLKDYKNAFDYFQQFFQLHDSLFNTEMTKQLADMETKYQTEKKQLMIDKLGKEKALQYSENKKQRIIILFVACSLLSVLVFSVFLFRMFIQKKRANTILAQQKEEISTQRDEIETQRDLVTEQKYQLEEIHKEVTDSINYAKRLQEALLPVSDGARSVLGEHFILFKPKDIVSGDFYWTTRVNKWLIVAVADCTGHGVPGAFMSMLGISFLTEIVNKKEITQASHVLDYLRNEIINALQQKGESGEQKDGMDISLLVLNTDTNECQWAGANNPLFLVTDKNEFKEIEPDKMPLSIHEHMENFTNHEFKLSKGDCIYLLSDGYEDQFGGPKNKKFRAKQLKELLLSIAEKPMNEQKEILNNTFVNWQGKHEQIDDVTVLGLRM